MKKSGYPIVDAALKKLEGKKNYIVTFSESEIIKLIEENEGMVTVTENIEENIYLVIKELSEDLISLQIKTEDKLCPVMNLVKSCSYNQQFEIHFNENAVDYLLQFLK